MDRHPGQAEVGETWREEDARRVFVSDRIGGAEPDLPPAPGSLGKAFGNNPSLLFSPAGSYIPSS